jgi:hypothetical protein
MKKDDGAKRKAKATIVILVEHSQTMEDNNIYDYASVKDFKFSIMSLISFGICVKRAKFAFFSHKNVITRGDEITKTAQHSSLSTTIDCGSPNDSFPSRSMYFGKERTNITEKSSQKEEDSAKITP